MNTEITNIQTLIQTPAGSNDSCNEPVGFEKAKKAPQNAKKAPQKAKKAPQTATKPNKTAHSKDPTPAFALFSQMESANIKIEHPSATSADVFLLLGDKWKTADTHTKVQWVARYVTLSDANKADGANMDHADGSTVALVADHIAKPKKRRDVNEPKRACTTFMLFSQVERVSVKAENPTATRAEMFKLLGEKWQAADTDTKAKYATLYVKNKARADDARLVYTYAKASGFY
jgi:hypothetical protein